MLRPWGKKKKRGTGIPNEHTNWDHLPVHLRRLYSDDICVAHVSKSDFYETLWFIHRPNVVFPDRTRQAILDARTTFCEAQYLIEHVERWEPKYQVVECDPLIVAYNGHEWFLVDAFDLDAEEEYVVREFTTGR